eukprot:m51a1_g9945 putative short-chain dehydrogenase (292) ;mRNA; r:17254-18180
MSTKAERFPPQAQPAPGKESAMHPRPVFINPSYKGTGKLQGKVAIVTGGDSGIGRAVCVHFAREGARVAILYNKEHADADETKELVEREGGRCVAIAGDLGDEVVAAANVQHAASVLSDAGEAPRVDVLVNNAGEQHTQEGPSLSPESLRRTFATNVFAGFYATFAALPMMQPGSCIINCTSVNAFKGHGTLIDYTASKAAQVGFTRSLALAVADRGIRVNEVAPGPVWTPLIVSSFGEEKVRVFGSDVLMKRAAQPAEIAPAFVFLASELDSSYITGQTIHPNGGTIVNS